MASQNLVFPRQLFNVINDMELDQISVLKASRAVFVKLLSYPADLPDTQAAASHQTTDLLQQQSCRHATDRAIVSHYPATVLV